MRSSTPPLPEKNNHKYTINILVISIMYDSFDEFPKTKNSPEQRKHKNK